MSLKIPDSPNIIGSEPVLRSPDIVQPVRETPNFSVDFSDLGDSVQQVGRAYQQMVKDQNTVYMNALKADYNKHMSDYQQQIFDTHKGKDALFLYDRYIRPESNKWLANAFGEPKEDGHIRIADKHLQKEFTNWVMGQQPTYISSAASYGQKQFDAWRDTVWEQQNNTAANMMLSATSNATIKNAIDLIRATEYDMNRGADKKYIEMQIAAKVDTGLAAYVNKRAVKDPYGAFLQLDNNPIVSDNLNPATKEKLRENIRSSLKSLATSQYADFVYSDGRSGSVGLLNDKLIEEVFGTTDQREIDEIVSDIKNKGKEKSDAIKKQQAGVIAQDTLLITNRYLEARTEDERVQAKKDLYSINPTAAIALDNSETENRAMQYSYSVLKDKAPDVISNFSTQIGQFDQLTDKIETIKSNLIKSGYSPEEATKIAERSKKTISKVTGFTGRDITDVDVEVAKNNMLSTGEYTPEQVDAAARIWKNSYDLKNSMDKYKELSARISSGELQAYDPETMGTLPPQMQTQLMMEQQVAHKYFKTKKDLESAGVNLDSILQDTGADAQYKNLDVASQNLLRKNIVTEVNKYKASPSHAGQLPDKDTLQGIVYRVQKNSVSPEMTLLQNISDAENFSSKDLTDEQRYSLAVFNAVQGQYNKADKRDLAQQNARIDKGVSRLADDSNLTSEERMYILANKEYIARKLQAGDTKGVATFIGLSKQGGFQW